MTLPLLLTPSSGAGTHTHPHGADALLKHLGTTRPHSTDGVIQVTAPGSLELGANNDHIDAFQISAGVPIVWDRIFYSSTASWSTSNYAAVITANSKGRKVSISVKNTSGYAAITNGSQDALYNGIFTGLQNAGVFNGVFTLNHEPENDAGMVIADWVAAQTHMAALLHAHTLSTVHGWRFAPIYMWGTFDPGQTTGNLQGYTYPGRLEAWYVPTADLLICDAYNVGGAGGYFAKDGVNEFCQNDPNTVTVQKVLGGFIDFCNTKGKSFALGEFSCARQSTDAAGVQRNLWLQKCITDGRILQADFICWFEMYLADGKAEWGIGDGEDPASLATFVSMSASSPPKHHATDAAIKKTATLTHPTNALVLKSTTHISSSDARILKAAVTAHSTDASVSGHVLSQQVVDAVVKKAASSTQNVNALLRSTLSRTQSTDAISRKTATRPHTTDVSVSGHVLRTQSVNSILQKAASVAQGVNALLKSTLTDIHSADAYVLSSPQSAHDTDAVLKGVEVSQQLVDASISAHTQAVHETDATIRFLGRGRTHDTDAVVRTILSVRTQDSDAFITSTLRRTHATDAAVGFFITHTRHHKTNAIIRTRKPKGPWIVTDSETTAGAAQGRSGTGYDEAIPRKRLATGHTTDGEIQ